MGEYLEFFKFAAKAGALEGYLYERKEVESLDCWVNNIEKMYASLPENVKADIRDEFRDVINRTLKYGDSVLNEEIKERLNNLVEGI